MHDGEGLGKVGTPEERRVPALNELDGQYLFSHP
ncbi:hypothetical protein BH10ACT1_BH10ACT1_03510 [soil metagenome]